ncbi:Uncharacterized protein Rs2_00943 [Raphanus sativus]|nr:Uncharacterized protein Rs2_00943 [Raphanus sativus]
MSVGIKQNELVNKVIQKTKIRPERLLIKRFFVSFVNDTRQEGRTKSISPHGSPAIATTSKKESKRVSITQVIRDGSPLIAAQTETTSFLSFTPRREPLKLTMGQDYSYTQPSESADYGLGNSVDSVFSETKDLIHRDQAEISANNARAAAQYPPQPEVEFGFPQTCYCGRKPHLATSKSMNDLGIICV